MSGAELAPARDVAMEAVTLVPEMQDVRPGQTARILVQSPFFPAEGVMSLRRSGLVSTERFTMDGPTMTLEVPIVDAHVPDLTVQVDLVGAAARTDDAGKVLAGVRDHHLRSTIALANASRLPSADPASGTAPSGSADGSGGLGMRGEGRGGGGSAPRTAEMTVTTMSRAAPARESAKEEMKEDRSRADDGDAFGGEFEANQAAGPAIAMRTDFSALALLAPDVRTDAAGKATVPLELPDSLTRYRIMVVAVDADRSFGSADSAITARLPLMVRPSAPRFLNFGDQMELPVVLQNLRPIPRCRSIWPSAPGRERGFRLGSRPAPRRGKSESTRAAAPT